MQTNGKPGISSFAHPPTPTNCKRRQFCATQFRGHLGRHKAERRPRRHQAKSPFRGSSSRSGARRTRLVLYCSHHAMALSPAVPDAPDPINVRSGLIDHRRLVAEIFPGSTDGVDEGEEVRNTLIHSAASSDNVFMLQVFPAGAPLLDLPDRHGRTALHWAADQGSMNVLWELLERGAKIYLLSLRNKTPLMLAVERGFEDIVCMLLQKGAGDSDRHQRGILRMGWFGSTALHCAAAGGKLRAAEMLIDEGFHREQRNEKGFTAAEVSAQQKQSSAVTDLLLPVSDRGGQLIHERVSRPNADVEVVLGLVQGGAFMDWQDPSRGETPLHGAVYFNHTNILRILLGSGANPNLRDHVGGSPLHMAAVRGETAAAEALVRAGADIEQPDLTHGASPLSWASRHGRTPIVRALLEAGAKADAKCASAGLTCLHWACRMNVAGSVDALLQAGADVNAVDAAGRNAYSMVGLGRPPNESGFQAESAKERKRRLDSELVRRIRRALELAKRDRA